MEPPKPKTSEDFFAAVERDQPTIQTSLQIQKIAQQYQFDWRDAKGVIAKLYEELEEIIEADSNTPEREQHIREEIGDFLFTAISLARHYAVDPDIALDEANRKFERRFQKMAEILVENGLDIHNATKAQLENAWRQAKKELAKRELEAIKKKQ